MAHRTRIAQTSPPLQFRVNQIYALNVQFGKASSTIGTFSHRHTPIFCRLGYHNAVKRLDLLVETGSAARWLLIILLAGVWGWLGAKLPVLVIVAGVVVIGTVVWLLPEKRREH